MPAHLPSHGARVAQSRSDVIDEVDGVPSTHTPRTAQPDRNVTTGSSSAAPLPFGAPLPIGAIPAVAVMAAIVLTVAVGAVLTVYADDADRWLIAAGFVAAVGLWCLLIPVLRAVVRWLR